MIFTTLHNYDNALLSSENMFHNFVNALLKYFYDLLV